MPLNPEASLRAVPSRRFFAELSIRAYLMLLIAAVLVPMLVLAGVLAWHYGDAERRTIEAQRVDVANNLVHLLDRDVEAMAGFLGGLSLAPGLQAGESEVLRAAASLAREHGFQSLAVLDRTGRLVAAVPADRKITGDAAGVAAIVAGQRLYVSDPQLGADGQSGLFYVSVPVVRDGQVAMVVSGGAALQRLQQLFAEAGLRQAWRAGIVDRNGIIVARSLSPDRVVGLKAQDPLVQAVQSGQASGLFDVVSRDGIEMKNSFQRSKVSGWTAAVAVPTKVIEQPFRDTAVLLAVAALALVLIGLLQAILVSGAIAGAVRQLGAAVVAFASRNEVVLPPWTVRELRDVLRVIESTAAMGRRQPGDRER
jgi:hypothetical protein